MPVAICWTKRLCAVPVPLHPWRRLHRGFNQAADLAATLNVSVAHLLAPPIPRPQTGLTAGARRRNGAGAFGLSPFVSRRVIQSMVTGGVVVLVDDVRTTGATLDACATVLKDAGAREVRALTVASGRPGERSTMRPQMNARCWLPTALAVALPIGAGSSNMTSTHPRLAPSRAPSKRRADTRTSVRSSTDSPRRRHECASRCSGDPRKAATPAARRRRPSATVPLHETGRACRWSS